MSHHHKLDCLVKRLDCSVVVKVKATEKVQNFSESSLHDISTAEPSVTKTWYGDALSWARVSSKKIGLLSSSSGSYICIHIYHEVIFNNMMCHSDLDFEESKPIF